MRILALIIFCVLSLQAQSKQILLLQSYNKGLKWSDDISKGIEEVLYKHKNYELTTEYMDSKKNYSQEYKNIVHKLFFQKLKSLKYDLVIIIDNYAIDFYLKHRNQLFKNTKVILCGMDKDAPGIDIKKEIKRKTPLVLETKIVDKNINFILKSLPKLKHLYVINDMTLTSTLINYKIENAVNQIKNKIDTKIVLNGDIEKIKEDLKKLPKKTSAVLFGSLFLNNKGEYIPYYQVNDLINKSPAPVFSLTDSHLGKGVIGGLLLTGYEQGYQTGLLAEKILKNIPIDTSKPIIAKAIWKFDYKILQKYNLTQITLPKNTIVLNTPKNFFEKNRTIINIIFMISPFLVLFLIIALLNISKRIKAEKKLIAQKNLSDAFLNNLESLAFWIDNNGIIKGCNVSMAKFINKEQEKIIGHKLDEIFESLHPHITTAKVFKKLTYEFTYKQRVYLIKNRPIKNELMDLEIVSIITDITEKKEAEINKQFIIQQAKLTEVGEMLSALVHQWKTPLVELSAVAHKMHFYHKKNKLSTKDIDTFFDVIMNQVIFMGDTMDSFRNFIKPSNKPVDFNISSGIKEILVILNTSLKYNNISIKFINVLEKDIYINGYPNEFKQVILNLINNAKDAILEAREKDESRGEIVIVLTQIEESVKIKIVDDGIGFSNDIEKRIFKPYFTSKEDGVGIGLYMAKLIIEKKMHGKIKAYSQPKGAKFLITLKKGESS